MTLLSNKKKAKNVESKQLCSFVSSCNIKVDHFCIFYYTLIFNFFICLYYVFACSICICLYVIDELYSFIINSIQCNFINFISEYITFLTSKSLLQFNIDLLFFMKSWFSLRLSRWWFISFASWFASRLFIIFKFKFSFYYTFLCLLPFLFFITIKQ